MGDEPGGGHAGKCPKVANGASDLLQDVFGTGKRPESADHRRRKPASRHAHRAQADFEVA